MIADIENHHSVFIVNTLHFPSCGQNWSLTGTHRLDFEKNKVWYIIFSYAYQRHQGQLLSCIFFFYFFLMITTINIYLLNFKYIVFICRSLYFLFELKNL